MKPGLNITIGYDPRQPIAYAVASHSVTLHSSQPLPITQLRLSQLPMTRRGLTEFTYTRFLTPYLADYSGISLFLDSDILCRADVTELLAHTIAYPDIPVFVVHHALAFERPSVMLFNNSLCRILTPDYVNDARNNLFNLSWARTVGELPRHWNHLVGYDPPNPSAKLVHFTKGIPIWAETRDCEYSAEWNSTAKRMFSSVSFQELMGRSVHV